MSPRWTKQPTGCLNQLKLTAMKRFSEDDIRDIAIRIVDQLVELGYVPNCMDTDNEDEFIVQDLIIEEINQLNN